jgi:molecular chaperone DnaK
MGTGKEQSIKITASSGLNEEEIKQMVREAEQHAAEDHQRRAIAEAHNKLDNLVYTTEKTLKDYGSQLDDASRKGVEDALNEARSKLESKDVDELNRAAEALSAASHKLAEAMYSKTRQAQGAQPGASGDGAGPNGGAAQGTENKDDVVDADFKEVK